MRPTPIRQETVWGIFIQKNKQISVISASRARNPQQNPRDADPLFSATLPYLSRPLESKNLHSEAGVDLNVLRVIATVPRGMCPWRPQLAETPLWRWRTSLGVKEVATKPVSCLAAPHSFQKRFSFLQVVEFMDCLIIYLLGVSPPEPLEVHHGFATIGKPKLQFSNRRFVSKEKNT